MGRLFTVPRILIASIVSVLALQYFTSFFKPETWNDSISTLKDRLCSSAFCGALPLAGVHLVSDEKPKNANPNCSHNPDAAFVAMDSRRANATFIILARNSELKGVVESIQSIEDRFNRRYNYPYVFLNDEEFTDEFKEWTSRVISSTAQYGVIPHDHWHQPPWIDEERARLSREKMVQNDVIYGGSVSYRNMCRFNSGFFFRHELVQPYRWYWRIEPGVQFYCDVNYDPFLLLEDNNRTYGFTISLREYEETVPTLWNATKEFIQQKPHHFSLGSALNFLSDDGGNTYNMCHFWSNFEIADMNFWRSEAYMDYFNFLDQKGGFYYERWGDAPVHSIAAALFLRKEQIHFFNEIGYRHDFFQHCPQGDAHQLGKCSCAPQDSFDWEGSSCLWNFARLYQEIPKSE